MCGWPVKFMVSVMVFIMVFVIILHSYPFVHPTTNKSDHPSIPTYTHPFTHSFNQPGSQTPTHTFIHPSIHRTIRLFFLIIICTHPYSPTSTSKATVTNGVFTKSEINATFNTCLNQFYHHRLFHLIRSPSFLSPLLLSTFFMSSFLLSPLLLSPFILLPLPLSPSPPIPSPPIPHQSRLQARSKDSTGKETLYANEILWDWAQDRRSRSKTRCLYDDERAKARFGVSESVLILL